MLVKNNCLKLLLSGFIAILPQGALHAEVVVLSTPSSGFAAMSLGISVTKTWSDDVKPPNHIAKVALPAVDYTGPYSGRADASNYSISGSIKCTDNPSQRGSSSAGDTVNLYADVVPLSNIRVKFQSDLSVNWDGTNLNTRAGFSFSAIGTEDKGSAISRQPTSVSPLLENKSWAVAVKAAATSDYTPGGKPYYKIGTFSVTGDAEILNPNTNAGYSSKITGVKAYYIGNALAYNDGGNQTWVVGKELPKSLSVKVADGETGTLTSSGIPITFSLISPVNGAKFSNGQTSIVTNTNAGIAAVKLTLGTSGGAYSVKAACPADKCTSGVKEVTFTETAVTPESVTELSIVQCEKYAPVNMEVRNAFIVRAFDTLTHEGESGWTVNFSAPMFPSGATGQKALPGTAPTNGLGISFSTVWTGDKAGEYTYTAKCPSCLKNTQVSCTMRSAALQKLVAEPSDDGPESGDPAVTPMLRISDIVYPDANDNVSFTTYSGENNIKLAADLKPDTQEYNILSADIAWVVEDSPADAIDSGNPDNPANGQTTNFDVTAPTAEKGRLLPLKYKIQASVMTPKGLVRSYPRHIKQDAIDKCRQEYLDISKPGEDLRPEPYFGKYGRLKFSPGTDGEFVKHSDCYAHIYPQTRAQEAVSLRSYFQGQFGISVTSGYRSARHNKQQGGVWNSVHQFGEAVDMQASPVNGPNMKKLWLQAGCPKILESQENYTDADGYKRTRPLLVLIGACDGTGETDWQNNPVEGKFSSKFTKDYLTDSNKNGKDDSLEDLNPKNAIADIFDRYARVIHLGQ